MGNIVLHLKLVKGSLITQWRYTLLLVCLVSTSAVALKLIRTYDFCTSESVSNTLQKVCSISQFILVACLIAGTIKITTSKLLANISTLKVFTIIGMYKTEMLFSLAMEALCISIFGVFIATYFVLHYQLVAEPRMLLIVIEGGMMVLIVSGTSLLSALYTVRAIVDKERCYRSATAS
ncbi:hypothetical protein MD588_13970 [Photobacterium sp. SDRW27]|uniref:hypothetical protein n=1 Tax=Photobacterium obscurum TaxID=2829490 RepID=UPI00224350DD|nr:hypothetical protein [Photobacterium obscurum]MCW8329912.1 hypothetical protein [Photobacterium obscurum]